MLELDKEKGGSQVGKLGKRGKVIGIGVERGGEGRNDFIC